MNSFCFMTIKLLVGTLRLQREAAVFRLGLKYFYAECGQLIILYMSRHLKCTQVLQARWLGINNSRLAIQGSISIVILQPQEVSASHRRPE